MMDGGWFMEGERAIMDMARREWAGRGDLWGSCLGVGWEGAGLGGVGVVGELGRRLGSSRGLRGVVSGRDEARRVVVSG